MQIWCLIDFVLLLLLRMLLLLLLLVNLLIKIVLLLLLLRARSDVCPTSWVTPRPGTGGGSLLGASSWTGSWAGGGDLTRWWMGAALSGLHHRVADLGCWSAQLAFRACIPHPQPLAGGWGPLAPLPPRWCRAPGWACPSRTPLAP